MQGILTIELRKLLFFAHHGLHAEERKTGNEFEVNLTVSYKEPASTISNLDDSINYAALFEIVKKEMDEPYDLLETLVQAIALKIKDSFPETKKLRISVHKLHPPIPQIRGAVGVTLEKEY